MDAATFTKLSPADIQSDNKPCHALMKKLLSSRSCFSFGTLEKKSSPVTFSTASTVTANSCNALLLPSFGRINAIIFCGGVKS